MWKMEEIWGNRWVGIGGGHEACLGRPRHAAIGRASEAKLTGRRLEAGPGYVDVVRVLVDGVGTHGEPFLVTGVVLLHDNPRAPGDSPIGGFVYLDCAVRSIGGEGGQVK